MPDNIHTQDDTGDFDVPSRPLPDEGGSPAQPPEEPDDEALPADHPAFDTDQDQHEVYDEGPTNASGMNDQHVISDTDDELEGEARIV